MNLTDLLKLYGDVQEHEPMSAHTTYKIGGTARWFIQPRSVTALMRIMQKTFPGSCWGAAATCWCRMVRGPGR